MIVTSLLCTEAHLINQQFAKYGLHCTYETRTPANPAYMNVTPI